MTNSRRKIFWGIAGVCIALLCVPAVGRAATIPVLTGNSTQAQTHLSLPAGGPVFIDLLNANLAPWTDGVRVITLTDSGAKTLTFILVSPGTGETYAADVILNGDMSVPASWATNGGWVVGAGVATGVNAVVLYQIHDQTAGELYKTSFDAVVVSGSVASYVASANPIGTWQTLTGTYTQYLTANGSVASEGLTSPGTFNGTADNVSIKQVLSPSLTGAFATVGTEQGGFNRNDTGGYSWVVSELAPPWRLLMGVGQ